MKRALLLTMAAGLMAMASQAKTLVVYYSYTGNCQEIVTTLTSQVTADVVRIEPVDKTQKYEANNYAIGTQLLNVIKANPNDAASYPAIDPVSVNLADYDNFIIVTPLWWSQMAAIMQTFLFSNSAQLAGKTVGLIVSSYSSGISQVVADAQRLLPNVTWAGEALWINNSNHQNRSTLIASWLTTQNFTQASNMNQKMYLTIDGRTMTATLADNSSAQALAETLRKADITYEAHDYGNFEKVGDLGQSFPQNNEQITTQPGDLILYLGSNLCIYYDTNSWDFTRIGRIDNATQAEIKQFVNAGGGNVTVRLTAEAPTGIHHVKADSTAPQAYTLAGTAARPSAKGIVITNGTKKIQK